MLEENENYIEKGGVESDEDEAIESDDGSDIDEDDENEKEKETYEKLKKSLQNFKNGQP